MKLRIGHGYDIHRLVEGRDLYLAGVKIPYERGLLGHSDADAPLHALCDAMLGAAGLNDIGYYFPPSDPAFKDISSVELLNKVKQTILEKGWKVNNIDLTIVAESPKISSYIEKMKEIIAKTLEIQVDAVGIKATTNEGIDQIGKGQAICAHAVCLLAKVD